MTGPHLLTGEVVPVVPALGGVAFGVATLATLLAFFVCWGLRHAWDATLGYMLRWLANECRSVSIPTGFFGHIHPLDKLADAFESVDKLVAHALAVAALNTEHAFIYCAHETATIFVWVGEETARLSLDAYNFALAVEKVWLPRAEHAVFSRAHHAFEVVIGHERRQVAEEIKVTRRVIHSTETKVENQVKAVAGTLAHELPTVHGLERDFTGLKKRLHSLEKTLSPAALVALIGATIFQTFGLEWLRCKSNPFHGNKNACGLWGDLSGLLGLATLALAATDLEKLAKEMQAVELDVTTGISDLLGLGNKIGL
jgi:hypothetical protein